MSRLMFNRRTLLKAGAASVVASGSMAGLAQAAGVTIGIVYVGPRDDYGWNQAHAVAAKALKSIPIEERAVPEGVMLVGDEYYYAENPPGTGVNNLDAPGHGTPAEEKAKEAVKNELF